MSHKVWGIRNGKLVRLVEEPESDVALRRVRQASARDIAPPEVWLENDERETEPGDPIEETACERYDRENRTDLIAPPSVWDLEGADDPEDDEMWDTGDLPTAEEQAQIEAEIAGSVWSSDWNAPDEGDYS